MHKKILSGLMLLALPLAVSANSSYGYDVFPARMSMSLMFEEDENIQAATLVDQEIIQFLADGEWIPDTLALGVALDYYEGYPALVIYDTDDTYYATLVAIIHSYNEITLSNEQEEEGGDLAYVELEMDALQFGYECYSHWNGTLEGVRNDLFRFRPSEEGRVPYTNESGILRSSMSGLKGDLEVYYDDYLVVGGSLSAILHPRRATHVNYITCGEGEGKGDTR